MISCRKNGTIAEKELCDTFFMKSHSAFVGACFGSVERVSKTDTG